MDTGLRRYAAACPLLCWIYLLLHGALQSVEVLCSSLQDWLVVACTYLHHYNIPEMYIWS